MSDSFSTRPGGRVIQMRRWFTEGPAKKSVPQRDPGPTRIKVRRRDSKTVVRVILVPAAG